MDILAAIRNLEVDPMQLLHNKIENAIQLLESRPELADQINPIIDEYRSEVALLLEAYAT